MRCMLENNLEIWRKKIFLFHEKYYDFDKKVKIKGDKIRWDKNEIQLKGNKYRGKKLKKIFKVEVLRI